MTDPQDASAQLLELWLAARTTVATLERAIGERIQADCQASLASYTLLCTLSSPNDPLNQQAIAAVLGLNKSSVSRQVEAAVKDGYATVEVSPLSRREKTVVVTPRGSAVVDAGNRVLAEFASDLDPDDAEQAIRLLTALSARNS
ncbi:MarR family winged helix-turn-helix transcriptional regulator [Leifsonia sp. YAF41]|uniref:MarR family winged helix-turn-helix transcriptional regulator n=1 Tax=Leifsonia sp. YAF41 TaxID=3233086 RepID=UPI003F9B4A48